MHKTPEDLTAGRLLFVLCILTLLIAGYGFSAICHRALVLLGWYWPVPLQMYC